MDRPLADKRPLGPFAQSDEFQRSLLGAHDQQELQEGNELMVLVFLPEREDPSRALDFLSDVVRSSQVEQFVGFEMTGEMTGTKEQITPGRDVSAGAMFLFVDQLRDPDVTIGQVEEFFKQELTGSPENVLQVNVHKA